MIAQPRVNVPKLALTAAEAAEALGVSERHLTSLVSRDEVPHVRLGHRIVFPIDVLRDFMRGQCERFLAPQQEARVTPGEQV